MVGGAEIAGSVLNLRKKVFYSYRRTSTKFYGTGFNAQI